MAFLFCECPSWFDNIIVSRGVSPGLYHHRIQSAHAPQRLAWFSIQETEPRPRCMLERALILSCISLHPASWLPLNVSPSCIKEGDFSQGRPAIGLTSQHAPRLWSVSLSKGQPGYLARAPAWQEKSCVTFGLQPPGENYNRFVLRMGLLNSNAIISGNTCKLPGALGKQITNHGKYIST